MVDIARFCHPYHRLNQQSSAHVFCGSSREFFLSPMNWISRLEGDNIVESNSFKCRSNL